MGAALSSNIHTLQEITSSGVDVTGIVDRVSMCVASYTIKFVFLNSVISFS